MIGKLAALILLTSASLFHTAEFLQHLSLTVAEVGDSVTLICPVSNKEGKFFHWYKQPLGYMAQKVVAGVLGTMTVADEFKKSRFTITKGDDQYLFTIGNISKGDEAVYFCQNGTAYAQTVSNGTFLAVKDQTHQKNVYVKQSLSTESVVPGDSVTLQCSLLSKNQESRVQCPGEHSVYWFRAGSSKFKPGVVYRHRDSSDEQRERSCVYSLSKTVRGPSDAGTYYCAVVTCGHILFSDGTKVETRPELDPTVLVLGVLLSCCVTVIGALIFCVRRRKVCQHCEGQKSASQHFGHDGSTVGESNDLGDAAETVNYVAMTFSAKKAQRTQLQTEAAQECVYSAVEHR